MKNIRVYLLTFLLPILIGCQANRSGVKTITPEPPSTSFPLSKVQGDTTPMPSFEQSSSVPNLQSLAEKAKEDLAQRLSVATSQINVVEDRDVVWSNSSLGCPQPGMMYADVLTPGYLILLNANGQDYEYHAGKNADAFLCENPEPPTEGTTDNT